MSSENNVSPKLVMTALVIALVGGLLFAFKPFKVIAPGYVGVQVTFGTVNATPLQPGLRFVNPVSSVTEMSTQIQKHEADYNAASRDMQIVKTRMALNYALLGEKAPETFRTIGLEFVSKIVDPAAQEVLKAVMAEHQASEILQQRQSIKDDVQKKLAAWLDKYGVRLDEVSISDVKFDSNYEAAIERKQIEEQKAQQKTYELQQAEMQAQIVAANAKGEADAAKARAQGEADSLRLRADAQADYNRKVADSLSANLLQQQYLDKWNGALPQITSAGSGPSLLLGYPANAPPMAAAAGSTR